ncbi:MAG: hypothetical protein WED04_06805 [Promethearchaeati archaeon SRVP18_Atabeyarchaeia-1]
MRKLTKTIGISVLALMLLSLSATSASAATYNYYLTPNMGAYATYRCLFSNSSLFPSNTQTTMGFMLIEKSMSHNATMHYQNNTYYVEGATIGVYLNDTLWDLGDVTIQNGPPYGLIFLPTSDGWWNFIKTFAEDPANNPSGRNNVTIGPSEVDVIMFTSSGGYNSTIWLTVDRHLGIPNGFSVLSVELAHPTNKQYYECGLLQYSVPSSPLAPEQAPPILVIGVAGVALASGLALGFLIGKRRV